MPAADIRCQRHPRTTNQRRTPITPAQTSRSIRWRCHTRREKVRPKPTRATPFGPKPNALMRRDSLVDIVWASRLRGGTRQFYVRWSIQVVSVICQTGRTNHGRREHFLRRTRESPDDVMTSGGIFFRTKTFWDPPPGSPSPRGVRYDADRPVERMLGQYWRPIWPTRLGAARTPSLCASVARQIPK